MTTTRVWSSAEFTDALRRLERYYHANHPYQRLMNEGALSQAQIQGWVANRYYYQVSVPVKDAALLANCPDRQIRRTWIQRLLDHDGDADGHGGIESWIQLGLAVGLSREEIVSQRYVLPGVRFAVDAYVNFVRQANWLEGVCSSLTELFAPTIHRERLSAWPAHYPWIDSRGLDYFRNRIGQAHRDVEQGLEIVLSYCDTAEKQRRAVDILGFKLEVLWSMLDAMYMAYVMQMPPFHNVEKASWAPESTDKA
jgi:pyrroloquinoline-quinone synthase